MTIQRKTTPVVDETQDDAFVEGPARYLGLLGRVGRALKPLSTQVRYLGYTSDLGEAFRPVVPPAVVKVFVHAIKQQSSFEADALWRSEDAHCGLKQHVRLAPHPKTSSGMLTGGVFPIIGNIWSGVGLCDRRRRLQCIPNEGEWRNIKVCSRASRRISAGDIPMAPFLKGPKKGAALWRVSGKSDRHQPTFCTLLYTLWCTLLNGCSDVARAAAHTATFQLLASIFIPMVVIHTQGMWKWHSYRQPIQKCRFTWVIWHRSF